MNKKSIVYIDGQYIKVTAQTLKVITPGQFQAKGVFETMLAMGGKVFDVKEHLKRMRGAFKGVRVSPGIIERVVKANGFAFSRVRVLAWQEGKHKHVAVMALKHSFSKKKVFKVCFIQTNRLANSRWANTKSLDYKVFADAYQKARAKGFDEALLINSKGYVFEASRANIFIISQGRLLTPPLSSGCLNGITRRKFIQMARGWGMVVLEKNLTPAMIKSATAAFLTNSLLGIKSF